MTSEACEELGLSQHGEAETIAGAWSQRKERRRWLKIVMALIEADGELGHVPNHASRVLIWMVAGLVVAPLQALSAAQKTSRGHTHLSQGNTLLQQEKLPQTRKRRKKRL